MDIGEVATAEISARNPHNDTGIELRSRHLYDLTASGRWSDFFVPAGADGYTSFAGYLKKREGLRVVPSANWFALIGTVRDAQTNVPRTPFVIGKSLSGYKATADGVLVCFANDMPNMYWNNFGSVTLMVTRQG